MGSRENSGAELSRRVESVSAEIERAHLRPLQKSAFICSADCCDKSRLSSEELRQCIDRCSMKVKMAEEVVNAEFQALQSRLTRCSQDCQDDAQLKLPSSRMQHHVEDAKMETVQREFEGCISKCVDKCISTLPPLTKKIQRAVREVANQ